jgi:serine/threonine-protein kinase
MVGRTVSHYRVLERVGEGATGVVYKAEDLQLHRLVALKFLEHRVIGTAERRRFVREAQVASSLDHPNVCTIFEIGETDDGQLFIVMAYYPGETLRTTIERGPIAVTDAVEFGIQIATGLAKAHSQGIIHRDIKPSNVIVTTDKVVKILDFGVAKVERDTSSTRTGSITGTVAYLAPEQARGEILDARADLWSLGVTLYEALTGDRPFAGDCAEAVIHQILTQEPASPLARRAELPDALDLFLRKSLKKERNGRFQTAKEMADELRVIKERIRAASTTSGGGSSPFHSIAVLPFVNLSADVENEYFSDGLTEELINVLTQVPGLRVVSRTSAFEFKGRAESIRRIGEQLGVTTVLEGSVRKSGDRLRITAQFVNAADGYHLWSERFDRRMQDVFDVQEEIAASIAKMLKPTLSRQVAERLVKRYGGNLEAYHLYLKGRYYANKRSAEGFQKAVENFNGSLAEDASYAPAHAGLADCYIYEASWGLAPPAEAWSRAATAARCALQIDDGLAEAHTALGAVLAFNEWDWAGAERECRRALERNPGSVGAHIVYNIILVQLKRLDEARAEVKRALELDPLSVPVNSYLAGIYYYGRDYDRSIEQARKGLELDANDIELHAVLGLNYEQKEMFDEAIAAFERARQLSGDFPIILGPLGGLYAKAGVTSKARAIEAQLEELASKRYVPPIAWAMLYIGLNDRNRVFHWLEAAADARDTLLCYLGVSPIYDAYRSHDRYIRLMSRIGLTP